MSAGEHGVLHPVAPQDLGDIQEEPPRNKGATKFEYGNTANYTAERAPSKTPKNLKILGEIHPLNILLVEDNKVYQRIVGKLLFELGYGFDVCNNGLEVMEFYRQRNYQQVYDVILMDLDMPIMNGKQTSDNIRRIFSPDEQPAIVALTGSESVSDTMFCLQHGFVYYIAKPISSIELARVLHKCQPLASSPARVTKYAPQVPQPFTGDGSKGRQ